MAAAAGPSTGTASSGTPSSAASASLGADVLVLRGRHRDEQQSSSVEPHVFVERADGGDRTVGGAGGFERRHPAPTAALSRPSDDQ